MTTTPDVNEAPPESTDEPQPIPLPTDEDGNWLAVPCRTCGVAVPVAPGMATETLELRNSTAAGRPMQAYHVQTFGLCWACAGFRTRAREIVGALPGLAQRHGSLVLDRLETAFAGLSVLGMDLPAPATATRSDMERLLRHMWADVSWFSHVREAPGYSMPVPFMFLDEDSLGVLRSMYAALLADRLATTLPPITVTIPPVDPRDVRVGAHPIGGGCLMCGAATVEVPATTRPEDAWTWRDTRIEPRRLGGRTSNMQVQGYTCRVCTESVAKVGVLGASAMERSLMVALGLVKAWDYRTSLADVLGGSGPTVDGVIGWGALVARAIQRDRPAPAPNATPWAHLGDPDALREHVRSGLSDAAGDVP